MSGPHPTATSTGLQPNLAGALAYLLGPFTGIFFLVVEKHDRFVRFHAAQAVVVSFVAFVANISLNVVSAIVAIVPVIGWLIGAMISFAFGVACLILWAVLMLRAYQGLEWEVPVASEYARKLISAR